MPVDLILAVVVACAECEIGRLLALASHAECYAADLFAAQEIAFARNELVELFGLKRDY